MQQKSEVSIPKTPGVHCKKAGAKGERYVYQYTKYFRNQDGKPRNSSICIGKIGSAEGTMHPNANYFKLFPDVSSPPETCVWDYGYSYAILRICKDCALLETLFAVFEEEALDLVMMASYILQEGASMDALADWQERTLFQGQEKRYPSWEISRFFSSITEAKRENFFRQWIARCSANHSVCYDVTSISSYSKQSLVEYGYNRDQEKLPQFNLGMFSQETGAKMPLYYNLYNGSLNDKTNLSYVLENARSVGLSNVKMVVDGGFWSEESFRSLLKCCKRFTVGMPGHLKTSLEFIDQARATIESSQYDLAQYDLSCQEFAWEQYHVPGRVLVFFSEATKAMQKNSLKELLHRREAELKELKHYPKNHVERYQKYFILKKHAMDPGFDYAIDHGKIDEIRKNMGYFLLFTNDPNASASDTYYYYRAKDADEKIFDDMKNDLMDGRMRTHKESCTAGKLFVIFLAVILRSQMRYCLRDYLKKSSSSLRKVIRQLSNIILLTEGGETYRLAKALTKNQQDILEAFGGTEAFLESIGK